MAYTRLALYIIGLLLVVAAAWVFLTQTPFARQIPAGVALAIILLVVGLGVMISANAIDDTYYRRRVINDIDPYPRAAYPPPGYVAPPPRRRARPSWKSGVTKRQAALRSRPAEAAPRTP